LYPIVIQPNKNDIMTNKITKPSDIFRIIFSRNGEKDYIGEPVTQIQHMGQAALLAENDGHSPDIIIGAFLHDIGHLIDVKVLEDVKISLDQIGIEKIEYMISNNINFGVSEHEKVGAKLCQFIGLPARTCHLIANHAKTKRYLITTDPVYRSKVSPASMETLKYQGGLMTEQEAEHYAKKTDIDIHIKMRKWDEAAKDPKIIINTDQMDRYFKMIDELIDDK
jgi:predicted HD phosphohydrolase